MIRHVMADGTRRDSIEDLVIPKDISESILMIMNERKKVSNGIRKTGAVTKK